MAPLIALIGTFLILVGAVVLIAPQLLRQTVQVFLDRRWMPVASIVRIILGLACILGADSTRVPAFVLGFGILILLSGIAIPVLGFERIARLANFWLERPTSVIRLWSLVVIALGSALVWAAV